MITSRAALLLIGLAICLSTGCSMCCGVYDYTYPTFGGKYERANPEYGRVGSIYSDPMADPGTPAVTNTQVPQEPRRNPIDLDEDMDGFNGQDSDVLRDSGSGNRNSTEPASSGSWR